MPSCLKYHFKKVNSASSKTLLNPNNNKVSHVFKTELHLNLTSWIAFTGDEKFVRYGKDW